MQRHSLRNCRREPIAAYAIAETKTAMRRLVTNSTGKPYETVIMVP